MDLLATMKGADTMNEIAMKNMAAINDLNKVEGFDPAAFLRKLIGENGEQQYYLDVKYRKLWFRLKYPEGKITKRIVKLDNDFAIIESKVYLNRTDPEDAYVSCAMAQRWRSDDDNYGKKYVETAETAAVGRALADAGFGIQFSEPGEDQDPNFVDSPATLPQNAMADDDLPLPDEFSESSEGKAATTQPTAPKANVTKAVDKPVELRESMDVNELISRMSLEYAKNLIIPFGSFKGKTMGEVCIEKPSSIKWFVDSYRGNNNLLRAAAQILLNAAA